MDVTGRGSAGILLATTMLLTAGCGSSPGSGDTPASDAGAGSQPGTAQSTPTPRQSATSDPGDASGAGSPQGCRTRDLAFAVKPGGAAAGSTYDRVVITNQGKDPCATGGYGGVSFVGAHGHQLGAPAQRDRSVAATKLTLDPGQSAVARLQVAEAGNYPRNECRPAQAKGLRIYPPNETHSAFVALPNQACASAKVTQLTLRPYRTGS